MIISKSGNSKKSYVVNSNKDFNNNNNINSLDQRNQISKQNEYCIQNSYQNKQTFYNNISYENKEETYNNGYISTQKPSETSIQVMNPQIMNMSHESKINYISNSNNTAKFNPYNDTNSNFSNKAGAQSFNSNKPSNLLNNIGTPNNFLSNTSKYKNNKNMYNLGPFTGSSINNKIKKVSQNSINSKIGASNQYIGRFSYQKGNSNNRGMSDDFWEENEIKNNNNITNITNISNINFIHTNNKDNFRNDNINNHFSLLNQQETDKDKKYYSNINKSNNKNRNTNLNSNYSNKNQNIINNNSIISTETYHNTLVNSTKQNILRSLNPNNSTPYNNSINNTQLQSTLSSARNYTRFKTTTARTRSEEHGNLLYNIGKKKMEDLKLNYEKNLKIKNQTEILGCSFKPQLNLTSRLITEQKTKIYSNQILFPQFNFKENVYERNKNWKNKKMIKHSNMRNRHLSGDYTFRPMLSDCNLEEIFKEKGFNNDISNKAYFDRQKKARFEKDNLIYYKRNRCNYVKVKKNINNSICFNSIDSRTIGNENINSSIISSRVGLNKNYAYNDGNLNSSVVSYGNIHSNNFDDRGVFNLRRSFDINMCSLNNNYNNSVCNSTGNIGIKNSNKNVSSKLVI